jgi:hypothetical protein
MAIGPLSAAILATGGAVLGASAGLANRGAAMTLAEKVAQDLTPGQSAVIADGTINGVSSAVSRRLAGM